MPELTTLQKALLAIKKLEQLLHDKSQSAPEPVAIVGLACRFPQAVNKGEYWQLLKDGHSAISHFPDERWNKLTYTNQNHLRDIHHPYWGGYLTDISEFDAYFFGITPREAIHMDPQQRLLLEVAYEAMEDSGIPIESIAGSNTGIFTSLYAGQFLQLLKLTDDINALYLPTGNASSIAANRLSYLLDLHGPSIVLDTACSASLVAAHLACLHLQNKLCDMAFVCGANINLLPSVNLLLTKAKMLSPDGKCKTFSADANGYVPGEGVGVIILKPLTKALHDNDRIYAVIAGSAINQDGKTNGLTAPNGLQQESLLQSAYQSAQLNPAEVSYVECHGTGTFLGDPIEAEAIGNVLGKNRSQEKPCWLGSVKTNVGHLEPAAGIASIIKVALSLQNSKIPPHLNFSKPNPHIAFDKYHLQIPQKLEDWPIYGNYRIAGINGFGFGGTNAHIILRELSTTEKVKSNTHLSMRKPEIFTLSAKDPVALQQLIKEWFKYLENNSTLDIAQLCYNTHVRRSHYQNKIAIIVNSITELSAALAKIITNKTQDSENIFISLKKSPTSSSHTIDDFIKIDLIDLCQMYVDQANIDWKKYEEHRCYQLLDMPSYPWQRKSYWPEEKTTDIKYPLHGKKFLSPLSIQQFEFTLSTKKMPELRDTYNVLHAGYYFEMAAFAINELYKQSNFSIKNIIFSSLMVAPDETDIHVQLLIEEKNSSDILFSFYSRTAGQTQWSQHAKGQFQLHTLPCPPLDSITDIKKRSKLAPSIDTFYERIQKMQMPTNGSLRWAHEYWLGKNEILCTLLRPITAWSDESFMLNIHLGIFDGCIQTQFIPLPEKLMTPYVASSIEKINFYSNKNKPAYIFTQLQSIAADGSEVIGNIYLLDENPAVIVEFKNVCMTRLNEHVKTYIDRIIKIRGQNNLSFSSVTSKIHSDHIIDFLIEQIATVFSMPKCDVLVDKPLSEMGIDSLMGLVLINSIESNFKKSISLQAVLDGPTITEIADMLFEDNAPPKLFPPSDQPWIAYRQHAAKAKARLFCFPYGGGGASIYKEWQRDLPNTIEVCPIQLPGKEYRIDEKPILDMDTLINTLIDSIQSELHLPFAVFGHSFGALLGFEFTRALRKRRLPIPVHLFVAAFPDPHIPTRSLDNLLMQLQEMNINFFSLENSATLSQLSNNDINIISKIFSDNGLTEFADHQLSPDIIKILLPLFISDMHIVKNYRHQEEPPLNIPITAFTGKQDTWVTYLEQLTWSTHTSKKFSIFEFDSAHLFIKNDKIKQSILKKIAKVLLSSKINALA